ncbi:hypothetical protein [Lysobacter antibioticus]|uniref:hypothetical protein n=1 Tax=Lysobacter antibioticus TaxID=84531 RepID=UPI0007171F50|nr:hypothetical protein [Lysobacter antibioticus]
MIRIFAVALLFSASGACAASQCFSDVQVVNVSLGYIDDDEVTVDSGNAVRFEFLTSDGRRYFTTLDWGLNLNDPVGRVMTQALQLAMTSGLRVTGYDHVGGTCDDVQEIQLTN